MLFPPPFLTPDEKKGGNKKETGCLLQLAFTTKVNHVTTLQVKQLICLSQTSGQMPLMG